MKLTRLDLVRRLAGIQDERAGEAVRTQRQTRDAARHEQAMLDAYRQSLCLARGGDEQSGQALRARAAFIDVADAACDQAQRQLASSETQLQEALRRWSEARERARIIRDKYAAAQRQVERGKERQAEKDLPSGPSRRRD